MKRIVLTKATATLAACLLAFSCAALPVGQTAVPVLTAFAEDAEYTEGTVGVLTYHKYADHIEITFCDKEAETVDIPASIEGLPVTVIAPHAFENCEMVSVTIPDSVTRIGYWSFASCHSLTSVDIPGSVAVVEQDAFADCTAMTSVTLHEGLYELEQGAFSTTAIKSITLPESLMNLRAGVFSYCTLLEEVNFPSHQVDVYSNVFQETAWLKARQAENPLVIVDGTLIDATTTVGDVVIPDGVTIIASQAFSMNQNVTSVIVPATVKNIWDETFYYCQNLKTVELLGVEYIGPNTFYTCKSMESIRLSRNLREIGEDAFSALEQKVTVYYGGTKEKWQQVNIPDRTNRFYNLARYKYSTYGDVNSDAKLSAADVIAVQKWLMGASDTPMENPDMADLDRNGIVDVFDLAKMKHALLSK